MKNLANRDLTEYWGDDDLDLSSPQKISMRKWEDGKGRFNGGYKYWDHWDRELYISVDRFLKSCIGRSFDKSFHKFCQKYPKYVGKTNTRNLFREYFFDKYRGEYYVDSNNCIRQFEKLREKKDIQISIPITKPTDIVEVDIDYIKSNNLLYAYLYDILGKDVMNHLMNCGGKIDTGFYDRIKYLFSVRGWDLRELVHSICNRKLNDIFKEVQVGRWKEVIKGTNDWYQYQAEKKDADKKWLREFEKEKDLKYSTLLKEIEDHKKEKERSLNIMTRDRMGFNDESFIGEPYHGRKGKTK